MRKLKGILLLVVVLMFTACSGQGEEAEKVTGDDSGEKISTDLETDDMEENNLNETIEPINDEEEEEVINDFVPKDEIPQEHLNILTESDGTIEHISYSTYDYFGDGSEITKHAYVYLPYNYDESKQYNVLYLMHGIGGTEREWGMYDENSKVKIMMDNLIHSGEIQPFIVVTPNGRSSKDFANSSSDHNSFYEFGQELRNDLIPHIEKNYSTYGEYNEEGYDLTAARDHRAMAGLSMGGMQTINIGLGENLDIISWFGAFSAAPTTNTSSTIIAKLEEFPDYDINYFYNICGTEDGIAIASSTAAVEALPSLTDRLSEDRNFTWQKVSGAHDFNIWYLGFYNFIQVVFA